MAYGINCTDDRRRSFLDALDESEEITVTDYEADFLERNIDRQRFTPAQRNVIDRMIARYGRRLSF